MELGAWNISRILAAAMGGGVVSIYWWGSWGSEMWKIGPDSHRQLMVEPGLMLGLCDPNTESSFAELKWGDGCYRWWWLCILHCPRIVGAWSSSPVGRGTAKRWCEAALRSSHIAFYGLHAYIRWLWSSSMEMRGHEIPSQTTVDGVRKRWG